MTPLKLTAPPAGLPDALAIVALAALVLVFNPDLAFRGMVPAGYDTFVYFYPLRAYVGQALAEGRLPLWNPHLFVGVPLLANPQAAVVYPGTWLFALLQAPYAYSLNLLGHAFVAAATLYAFGRASLGVSRLAGLLGGAAFAFSGFMAGQAGHLNQVSVAAWLPAAALALDATLRARGGVDGRPRWAPLALVTVLVLQLLAGHPQEVYMTLVVLGVVVVWRRGPRGAAVVVRGLGLLLLAAALAFGIAAVQLLPTAELARLSIRSGGLDYAQATAEALPWQLLLPALLPGFWENLQTTEFFGHIGAMALALACLGLAAAPGHSAALGGLLVTLGLVLAVGDATPLYRLLFDWAPGFGSFRVPARWLMVYTFGAALLVALGADRLMRVRPGVDKAPARLFRSVGTWRALAVGCGVPLLLAALVVYGERQSRLLLALWAGLAGVAMLLAALALVSPRLRAVAVGVLLAGALAELWLAGANLEHRHPIPNLAFGQPRESTAFLRSAEGLDGRFRMLSIATPEYEVKERPEYEERFAGLHPEALRNLLMSVKWTEALVPNVPLVYGLDSADGYDGGVLPLADFVRLTGALLGDRVRPDGVLASRLDHLPPGGWLDLLGVRYVLAGRIKDVSRDGLYYDRAVTATLRPGERFDIDGLPLGEFTRLGLLSSFQGPARAGEEIARLELGDPAGGSVVSLRAGVHTAAADARPDGSGVLEQIHEWGAEGPNAPADWLGMVEFARRSVPRLAIVNTTVESVFEVRAMNLVDDVRQASFSITPDPRVGRVEFFDMKVYERRAALPRAYVATRADVLDDAAALAQIADPGFDPRAGILLAPMDGARALDGGGGQGDGPTAVLESVRPEQVRLRTRSDADGYAVLSDSWYPGWRATVDGRDAPIIRANVLFRAVAVPAGEHVVELSYQPASFRLGLAISLASLGATVVLWLVSRRLGRRAVGA